MKKILVTGGAGNIGSSLVKSLLEKDFEVFVFDNFITGNRDNLPEDHPRLRIVKVDINNKEALADHWGNNQFEFVFHYAALVGVERTQNSPI